MNKSFERFCKKIEYTPEGPFEKAVILNASLEEESLFSLKFELPQVPNIVEMKKFIGKLNDNFNYKTKLKFQYIKNDVSSQYFYQYTKFILEDFLENNYLASQITSDQFRIEDNVFHIEFLTERGLSRFQEVFPMITKIMNMLGIENKKVLAKLNKKEELSLKNFKKQKGDEISKQMQLFKEGKDKIKEAKKSLSKVISIYDSKMNHEDKIVTIEGMIFGRDDKKTKTGWHIIDFSITDFEDAIYATKFISKNESDKEPYNYIQKEQWVRVTGKISLNKYKQNEHEISVVSIEKIEDKMQPKKDELEEKRVELNVKTRMSTMDGIVSASELIERAKLFGHKAVAITDSGSVQSFPNMFNAAKNIKAIYGISLNMIERNNGTVFNLTNKNIADPVYVIFDLETTGLSPIVHEIIEFGAIKLKGGKIIDRKQFFIKPKKDISDFTTSLTGITNDMVQNGVSEEEGIKEILNYFKDSVLIAHNAPFDMGFIHQKIEQYGLQENNSTYIDTVAVAKILEPNAKRFNLEKVATRMGHQYNSTIAHRADYDAEVLANVWMSMSAKLRRQGIDTLEKLSKQINDKIYSSQFSKEISFIAKNNKGLKELFKLVSLTSTNQYYNSPKLFWDQLPTGNNILIGSGGLKSKLVDLILTGTKKQIIENISKYDYIEIQPLRNFSHLFSRGNIERKQLIEILKFVISESKKQKKLVVATGDVRYLDEKDKLYHSVYINAKGLGGVRHYLFKYNETKPDYPIQSFLTTQEMIDEFHFLDDELVKEIVVKNTNIIADQIEECIVIKDKLYTPKIENSDKILSELVWNTAKKIYGEDLPKIVKDRTEKELGNIIKYGFGVIYYISHKLVKKSIDDGYLVGSRGSVGSSIVATFSGITEVNPLPAHYICDDCKYSEFFTDGKYSCGYDLENKSCPKCKKDLRKEGHDIPFETFLGFEANKVPDIDLNFSGEYQPIIHKEVEKEFGKKNAFRAGTISTVAEKTAFGYVLAWAEETGKNLSRAFTEFVAKKVSGTKRTTGQHPGGIIVIPNDFDAEDFTPINYPANDVNADWLTTHFDFHAIHDNVLKLDLLGHDDPTAIRMLQKLTGIKPGDIPYTDKKVISLFSSTKALNIKPDDILGETTGAMGIPEFGTQFVRGMLKSVTVKSFSDLVSISGLSHGTDVWSNNGEVLVKKHGKTIKELISCRDDIMIDLVNKGIDPLESFIIMEQVRKGKSVTAEQEKKMRDNGVEEWYIDSCKAIKYMFPKAHATAYVQMAWKIAWFKTYYPLEYYATYLTNRADVFDIETFQKGVDALKDKLVDFKARRYKRGEDKLSNKDVNLIPILELVLELYARGFKVGNINIQKSLSNEWIIDDDKKTIIPPFSSIDGLGDSVADSIIAARKENIFSSIEDLKNRTSLNKTSLEKLEKLNVFEGMEKTNQLTLF